jgi:hypothetical protein
MTTAPFATCASCEKPDTCGRQAWCEKFRRLPRPAEPVERDAAEAWKADAGKLPMHLIAPELPEEVAAVLGFGAAKYGERNWERGMAWSRAYAALQRHMWAWWGGEDRDPETGMSHLAHAGCCLMFLLAYERRGHGADDRPRQMAPQGGVAGISPRDTREPTCQLSGPLSASQGNMAGRE